MGLELAVIQRFLPPASRGGVGHFTVGLCSALAKRGHTVTVISQDPKPPGAPFEVMQLPGKERRTAPLAFPLDVASVDFSRFDLIHAQGDEQLVRHRGRPVVRTLHGSSLDEAMANGIRGASPKHLLLHAWFFAWELVCGLRADALVGVSHAAGRHALRSIDVIPNGIDAASFAPDGTPKSSAPSILFVGELDSRKRGRWLVREFVESIRPRLPNAELWLVSPDRAEGPGVENLGTLDDVALRDRYRRAWVMCLPSAYEGFGRPYAEALAAGTVAAATPNPGAHDVLDGGRFGLIADDRDLSGEIVRLLNDRPRMAAFEQAGLARAAEYDWSRVAAAYERVYARVLEGSRAAT